MALSVSCTLLHISKCVSWVLRIPVLPISCQEAVTLVIKPCALIPDSVHMCCTLVFGMLCHPSHGTDCPNVGRSCDSHWDLIACIIRYLNSNLTLPLNWYHGPPWYFVRRGSPVLTSFPVRPNQLILKTSRSLFVPTVLWTSPQGYPPLGCDRLWLVGLRLVPVHNGNKCPYVWSVFVVPDLLLKIWLPDYRRILWLDVWMIYQFPVRNFWAMLPVLWSQQVPYTLLLPLIMWLFFVVWNASLSHRWLG